MASWDVIVIGAGHNGLAAAAHLAKAGKRVLVCERTSEPGGLAKSEPLIEGYRSAGVRHDTSQLRPWAVEALQLTQHGLNWSAEPAPVYVPVENAPGYILHQDPGDQGEGWKAFTRFVQKLKAPLGPVLNQPPMDLIAAAKGDISQVWKPGLRLRKLGKTLMYEALRVPPMCVADWMRELFSNEAFCAAVAMPSVAHAFTGPWSPGTAGTLLHYELSRGGHARGGPAAVVTAMVRAAESASVELRTSTGVERILVESGMVRGVALAGGTELSAKVVLSTADPRTTVLDLLHPRDVPWQLENRITHFRGTGTTAILRLALGGLLSWKARPDMRVSQARLVTTLDGLEQSFDPVKYGEFARRPSLDLFVPTVEDPSLAPDDCDVVTVHVHAAPYDRDWTDADREGLAEAAMSVLKTHAEIPRVLHRELLTPWDIEARYGTKQGHLLHGDHALDQLMIRPSPECSGYITPIRGLYLGGSGSHPGGGVTAAPGLLGAKRVLSGG